MSFKTAPIPATAHDTTNGRARSDPLDVDRFPEVVSVAMTRVAAVSREPVFAFTANSWTF
jgi:hypothetical protein